MLCSLMQQVSGRVRGEAMLLTDSVRVRGRSRVLKSSFTDSEVIDINVWLKPLGKKILFRKIGKKHKHWLGDINDNPSEGMWTAGQLT